MVGGVHFVKFHQSRPHEILTHIHNDTDIALSVTQSGGRAPHLPQFIPAMATTPYSLDDPWGSRLVELRSLGLRGGEGWRASFSLQDTFVNRPMQPMKKPSSSEAGGDRLSARLNVRWDKGRGRGGEGGGEAEDLEDEGATVRAAKGRAEA